MFHLVERAIDIAGLQLDSAAAIDNNMCVESKFARVEGAVFDAVIQGQSHQVNVLDPALLKIMRQSGVTTMRIIEECTVAVDHSIGSFVENVGNSACVKCGSDFSAARILNAMHRPQNLFDAIEKDALARLFARVIGCEAPVVGRMPVLRRDDEFEALLQFIHDWNYFVAARYSQAAARQEIILKINNDQRVHLSRAVVSF